MTKRNRASARRRNELKAHLIILAGQTTKAGTLAALAKKLGLRPENLSVYIREGEVPARRAAEMLRLDGANSGPREPITLQDLCPYLA